MHLGPTACAAQAMELSVATQLYQVDISVLGTSAALEASNRVADFVYQDGHTAPYKLYVSWTGMHYEPVKIVRTDTLLPGSSKQTDQ